MEETFPQLTEQLNFVSMHKIVLNCDKLTYLTEN